MARLFRPAARLFADRGGPLAKGLYRLCAAYVGHYRNNNYDGRTNGEFRVLKMCGPCDMKVVVDVGANVGDYTQACLDFLPDATVHCFEVDPPVAERFASRHQGNPRVVFNPIGLSDKSGEAAIHSNDNLPGLSSLISSSDHGHHSGWRQKTIQVETGDAYCAAKGVERIDLLKIDVEGAEHLVLRGFERMLNADAIRAVQFEYGAANFETRFLLRDYWDFFTQRGFVLGPVMRRGVRFKNYQHRDESLPSPPNYLAVQRKESRLVDAVTER